MSTTELVPTPIRKPEDILETKLELIKRTVAAGATNDELEIFMHQCRKTGLDPLARQIYFVKRQGKGTIQTGIDGYRLVAERTGKYAGNDDPVFQEQDGAKNPFKATVTVWKSVEGVRCPFTATAHWAEYYPGEAQGWAWKKMPHVMLGKCAEALALRKAFPAELSGVYTFEEMEQAGGGHVNTLVGACVDCGAEIPADETKCSGCKKPSSSEIQQEPQSEPTACENCGDPILDVKVKEKGKAERIVHAGELISNSKAKFDGMSFCGACQVKISKERKLAAEQTELGITDKDTNVA